MIRGSSRFRKSRKSLKTVTSNPHAEARAKFLNHLRTNPDNRTRIDCALTDGKNGRCALGLGLEGLGIDLRNGFEDEAYQEGADALGFFIDSPDFALVWRLSDKELPFAKVADKLEKKWPQE